MLKSRFINIVAIVLIGINVFAINNKPIYGWDILPYMALIFEHDDNDINSIHDKVYSTVKTEQEAGRVRSGAYGELVTERIPYRAQCFADAEKFQGELTYYRTKPLYHFSSYILYKVGISPINSTIIPSMISAFFILLILFFWLARYSNQVFSLVITLIAAQLPAFLEIQNNSAPDAMSHLFLFLSLYLYDTRIAKWMILMCLGLAILTRVDNVIFSCVLTYFIYQPSLKSTLKVIVGSVAICIVAFMIIPYLLGNNILWFRDFKFLESHVQYYFHVRNVFRELQIHGTYLVWTILGIVMLFHKNTDIRRLATISGITVLIHLILFPSLQERFFVSYEFLIIVMLLMGTAQHKNKKASLQENTVTLE
ncbi:MAG: hypothetical protein H6551_01495 [Chitinophagales bacterium]|nr:hypothetical protein [Chitinophagaceae bacterium]MCB9063798.1 hypothetical protein [Chitinophagales bacterium]